MLITAGKLPPAMSAISAGGTTGCASAGAALAIAGDRAIDQPRIERAHVGVAETEPRHHAGTELLNQDVGAHEQRLELFAVGLALEIDRKHALAAVEHGEGRALAVEHRWKAPHVLAARALDLDHLGAGFR